MRGEPVRGRLPEPGFYSRPGIDQATAIGRGLVPRAPLAHLTGLNVTQVAPGTATLTAPTSQWLDVGDGLAIQVLSEAAVSTAVLTIAPGGTSVRTAALSFTQFRPATLDADKLIAHARTIRDAPTFTYAESVIEDDLGREIARVIGAVVVRAREPLPPAPAPLGAPFEEPAYPTPDPYLRPLPAGVEPMSREDWEQHDGLTLMRMYSGAERLVPIGALFGLRLIELDRGFVRAAMTASDWFCLREREVSAGAVATAADIALTAASTTLNPPSSRLGVINTNIRLLRPVAPDGREIVSEARVVDHQDDSVVTSATLTDADGQRIATAYQTAVRLPMRPRPVPQTEPVITTVAFTDLVGSTARARELGDRKWRELLAEHEKIVRHQLGTFRGREIKTTGDGFLLTFDSPARAVRCAQAVRESTKRLGLQVRAGIHTGECEFAKGDVTGIAVHVASRVLDFAAPDQVLVSGTVRDLLLGSGLRFEDRGRHELKGIEGKWQLYAVCE